LINQEELELQILKKTEKFIERKKKEYDELQADLEKYKQQSEYNFCDVKMGGGVN